MTILQRFSCKSECPEPHVSLPSLRARHQEEETPKHLASVWELLGTRGNDRFHSCRTHMVSHTLQSGLLCPVGPSFRFNREIKSFIDMVQWLEFHIFTAESACSILGCRTKIHNYKLHGMVKKREKPLQVSKI